MEIEVLGTGSSGNCYRISNGKSTFLLECGLPFKLIQRKLDFKVSDIDFCLVSHSHFDHSKACKDLLKNGVDVYMTDGTADSFNLTSHRLYTFSGKEIDGVMVYDSFDIGCYTIKPFMTIHDVKDPVGFYITDNLYNESLFFVTDTAYLLYKIPKADYLMIECNYVKKSIDQRVENYSLNVSLRNRIVKNHMSLETVVEALKVADLSKCRRLYALHLSSDNSDEELIKKTLQEYTGVEVVIA